MELRIQKMLKSCVTCVVYNLHFTDVQLTAVMEH